MFFKSNWAYRQRGNLRRM